MDLFLLDNKGKEAVTEAEKFFEQVRTGHSGYQIRNFVIDQFITPDRKYYQCLREMHKRYRGIVQFQYEYNKLVIAIKRLKRNKFEDELDIEENNNEINFKKYSLALLKMSFKDTVREFSIFLEYSKELEPQLQCNSQEESENVYWPLEKYKQSNPRPVEQLGLDLEIINCKLEMLELTKLQEKNDLNLKMINIDIKKLEFDKKTLSNQIEMSLEYKNECNLLDNKN